MAINDARTTANEVLDRIVSVEWLYEKVFWKLLDKLVYDRVIDDNMHVLKNIYKFDDTDEVFKRDIERREFRGLSEIVFKYQRINQEENDK